MISRVQARPFVTFLTALLLFHATDFSCSAGTDLLAPRGGFQASGTVGDIVDVERVQLVRAP